MAEHATVYTRFTLSDRVQHIVLFTSFSLLSLTGVPQKYGGMGWAQTMIGWMGGVETARVIHRIAAAILIVAFVYHVVRGLWLLLFKGASFDMWPRFKDVKDVVHNLAYFLGFKRSRPRFERFNYMEKFEYWALLWGTAVMVLTGLVLWFPIWTTRWLPGVIVPSSKELHSNEALLAVFAIVLWHLFNAHFNPRVFPMNMSIFTGRIAKHEMMAEHALEYERKTGEQVPEEILREQEPKPWPVLITSGALGAVLVALYVFMIYWVIDPPSPQVVDPVNTPIARQLVFRPPAVPEVAQVAAVRWQGQAVAPPLADFSIELAPADNEVFPNWTFHFVDQSAGDVSNRTWHFGDGQRSSADAIEHTYTGCPGDPPVCTVSLTVCGAGGCDTAMKRLRLP